MLTLQGKVIASETGLGIPNLNVQVLRIKQPVALEEGERQVGSLNKDKSNVLKLSAINKANPSIGSTFTNAVGDFVLHVNYSNDIDRKEKIKLEHFAIQLIVRYDYNADSENQILYTSEVIQVSRNNNESFLIRVPLSSIKRLQQLISSVNIHEEEKIIQNQVSAFEKTENLRIKSNQENLKAHLNISKKIKEEVDNKFNSHFLSRISESKRKMPTYFNEKTDKLEDLSSEIIKIGLKNLKEAHSVSNKTLKFSLSEKEKKSLGVNGKTSTIDLSKFLAVLNSKVGYGLSLQSRDTSIPEFGETNLELPPQAEKSGCTDNKDSSKKDIKQQISHLISSMGSPEGKLKFNEIIDQCYKNTDIQDSVNNFSLRGGAADVDAFHDFHILQIAFEHIWTEIFGQDLIQWSKSLYSQIVKVQEGYQEIKLRPSAPVESPSSSTYDYDSNIGTNKSGGLMSTPQSVSYNIYDLPPTDVINTVDDLEQLLNYFKSNKESFPHLEKIVSDIDKKLSEKYSFTVFAPNYINYGIMLTYRQKWKPISYQVGRLVSSIPLAPKETRKYTSKSSISRTRNNKEIVDQDEKFTSDSTSTSRFEQEILEKAINKTSFELSGSGKIDFGIGGASLNTSLKVDAERFSQDVKKNFRESVVKAASEVRRQTKTEIDSSSKEDLEVTNSGEISNPNDEITVTYLFYELQRRYKISEKLHKLTPVIFVANEVPTPDQIDYDWLMANAWILRRVILDSSFLPAFDYLNTSILGEELNLEILKKNYEAQLHVVESMAPKVSYSEDESKKLFEQFTELIKDTKVDQTGKKVAGDVMLAIFTGGLSLIGQSDAPPEADPNKIKEAAQLRLEWAQRQQREIQTVFRQESDKLATITGSYTQALRRRMDMEHQITLLRIHIKANILYYMQAIWDYEPSDQRFFRLYDKEITWWEAEGSGAIQVRESSQDDFSTDEATLETSLKADAVRFVNSRKKLVEVADLDNILGYKGNYSIFPAKERSYLHLYMMQDFIDTTIENGLRDPDGFGSKTAEEVIDYLRKLKKAKPADYEKIKEKAIKYINKRLSSPQSESDEIVVPTDSIYIEALPGTHPIMEDFKLAHRALDVKKVQAEVRQIELENLRYAARILDDELDDPTIERITIKKK